MIFFWFRRDLRLKDNVGLYHALNQQEKVIPLFIFDDEILADLESNDARVSFIYKTLKAIDSTLKKLGSSLLVKQGNPLDVWQELVSEFDLSAVYFNNDYEPYAILRDKDVKALLEQNNIATQSFKDQVIFEKEEILKDDKLPYTVFTPYKNKWLKEFDASCTTASYYSEQYLENFYTFNSVFPTLASLGFVKSTIVVQPYTFDFLAEYDSVRDFPSLNKTSLIAPYLRFGLLSARALVIKALENNASYLSELIWREFFMQILYHFPHVVTQNFKVKYNAVQWRNNEDEFKKWCNGETGYPLVDAGMRQLNQTGFMHNRVRMVAAGFLCKHLLIDWRWGEAYFAKKLLDYDLAANNGNWQWAAGTGCDAAPYFRIFNPAEQIKKFDKDLKYINTWLKDFNELSYPEPIVDHKSARERALEVYKKALNI